MPVLNIPEFESRSSLNFVQALISQLLKLCTYNCDDRSWCLHIFLFSSNIWYICLHLYLDKHAEFGGCTVGNCGWAEKFYSFSRKKRNKGNLALSPRNTKCDLFWAYWWSCCKKNWHHTFTLHSFPLIKKKKTRSSFDLKENFAIGLRTPERLKTLERAMVTEKLFEVEGFFFPSYKENKRNDWEMFFE